MKNFYLLLISVLFSTILFAQKVDYDNDSRWFWGINAGASWSKTDIKYKTDMGFGLMLGRQFNYNYGKKLSYDVRLRYLTGLWKGYNRDTSNVSGIYEYGIYTNSGSPVILNYGTRLHEFSLELALHFNTLRERTGWDPYIFGGIGYTFYRTKGDLYDANGATYVYDSTKFGGGYSQKDVMNLTDKKFDTDLNAPVWQGRFMPSIGFGIGYQVGKWFSIGLEHKTTFTLNDNFDGQANATGKFKNDWYHYTSAYLRFHIRSHYNTTHYQDSIRQNTNNNNNINNNNNTNNNTNNQTNPDGTIRPILPIVDFTNPTAEQITVNSSTYVIRGRIQYVPSTSNVRFTQNGTLNTNFSFNPSTQNFQATVNLVLGTNTFVLTGSNEFGSDDDQVVIIYMQENKRPPIVTYTNPSTSPITVQSNVFNLSGTVQYVTGRQNISMTLNGQSINNFTFDQNSTVITAPLTLVPGTNVVTTTGVNQDGTDSKSTTIIYQQRQVIQPPVVYFTNPNVNPYTSSQATFNLQANVLHVDGSQHISFKQNGIINQNFVYNNATQQFSSNVVLVPGQNVFEITGVNEAGTASASTIIIYQVVAPKPPVVTFTNPPSSPTNATSAIFNLSAVVLNVTTKSQIQMVLNGVAITTFNFNPATSAVTSTLSLIEGSNVVQITGTNDAGTDSKQTILIYKKPVQELPPVVQFTNPSVNPFTTSNVSMDVTASILNVPNRSGVTVVVNGVNRTDFTYSIASLTLPLTLIEGANTIVITGTNSVGTDQATQTIIYRKPVTVLPPVVTFVNPIVNPFTSLTPSYQVKARVQHVTAANQIVLKINGQTSTNFSYTASNEMMEFNTGLINGSNVIEITATNSAGSDFKNTVIIYKAPDPTLPPVVTITFPTSNPISIGSESTPIVATVLNVTNQNQIQVLFNGAIFSNFTYSTTTKVLNMTCDLIPGANTIQITASNSAGTASDSQTINHEHVEILPPAVSFTNPATPGTIVSVPNFVLTASTINVNAQNELILKHDGQVVNPSFWSFDIQTKKVTYNLTLNIGNNVFELAASNAGGSSSATTSIVYKKVEVPCVKPTIDFTNPANATTIVDNPSFNVKATVSGITAANQTQLFVNGTAQTSPDFAQNIISKTITLIEGLNAIEVKATNTCGTTSKTITLTYKPKVAPCQAPNLTMIKPVSDMVTTTAATVSLQVQTSNVTDKNQLMLNVNGNPVDFTFDVATQMVQATIPLSEGEQTVILSARNPCGTKLLTWKMTRNSCKSPVISISTTSIPNGTSTTASAIEFSAIMQHVENQNDIHVKHNGVDVAFVYNSQTGILTVNRNLTNGQNSFVIQLRNSCGETNKELVVTHIKAPIVPPTITITNPASSPFVTSQAAQTVHVQTTGVTAASQVVISVNGVNTNFSFNTNGSIQFNATFNPGQNIITATAATSGGTASDTKTVVYNPPASIQKPVITLINPSVCPAIYVMGRQNITGTVSNVSNASQVSITYNGENVTFQSTISNNVLTFSFLVSITGNTMNFPLVITATNAAGTATKSCLISVGKSNNGHGNNTDGTDESNPGQGNGGPNGGTNGSTDDENGNGSNSLGTGNSQNSSGNNGTNGGNGTIKPGVTRPNSGKINTTGNEISNPRTSPTTRPTTTTPRPTAPRP